MKRQKAFIYLCVTAITLLCCTGCGHREVACDPLLRSRVDGLNKQAFVDRYKEPQCALDYGYDALDIIHDSLPQYQDGKLRAWNTMAFDYFILSRYDSAETYLNKVLDSHKRSPNLEREQVIAQLLQARLYQRSCRIADCYELLQKTDKDRRVDVKKNDDKFLYDYAQMQYYITSLTLDYYYRKGQAKNLGDQLNDITEQRRNERWRCDYAQDLAFNYAMAYCYMVHCDSVQNQVEPLSKCLYYVTDNLHLLSDSASYTVYFMANTLQLLADLFTRPGIRKSVWQTPDIQHTVTYIREELCNVFNFCPDSNEDYILALYQESTALFWKTHDPYQRLGSVVAAANYAKSIGDTDMAHTYYSWVLADSTLLDNVSLRFNAAFYRGLIETHYTNNPKLMAEWFEKERVAQDFIAKNEKADFELRNELSHTTSQNRWMWLLLSISVVAFSVCFMLVVKLHRRTRALHKEKAVLQAAKQKDKERIANVETCLSVLRHDVNPFISYLNNKNIPESMRKEVVEQLLRTFDNIKSWTNLSIPNGLQYNGSIVPLQDVFDAVEGNINKFQRSQVQLTFEPTPLRVYGDPQLLQILLRNLVNNALQYTTKGYVSVCAETHNNDSRFVCVTVKDTGCGMTPEELDSLFRTDKKPHQTTGSNGYGSGFGLILCRYIIKKHDDNTLRGCRIWAESEENKGTKMMFLVAQADALSTNSKTSHTVAE